MTLTGKPFGKPAPIGGYNLCYLREGANLAVVTEDEYKAPVVASWYAGAGRALCYTGQVDGEYTGPIAKWDQVGDFFTSLARWAGGDVGDLPENMLVTQDVRNDTCMVELHLDPEREGDSFSKLPTVTVLRAVPGRKPQKQQLNMQWTSADTLGLEVPLYSRETVLCTVEVPQAPRVTLSPLCLPYCPEFKPFDADRALEAMEQLAAATGGVQRIDLAAIWDDLPKQPRMIPIGPWLLFAAMILLLAEILERRTGALSMLKRRRKPPVAEEPAETPTKVRKTRRVRRTKPSAATREKQTVPATVEEPAEESDMLDAFTRARQRAKRRTRR